MRTRVVILAAGKGKRMKSDTPKVLIPMNGKPLLNYLLESVKQSGVDPRPVVVVGFGADLVKEAFGDGYEYVLQKEQLGTGHAVRCAQEAAGDSDSVIVLYGDMPFVRPETILNLQREQQATGAALVVGTTIVEDFNEWRAGMRDFSRIVRDGQGKIKKSVEVKDANETELAIKELNTAFFCFDAVWLWNHLTKLTTNNMQKEYYLTDLVSLAIEAGDRVGSLAVDPSETLGINMPEHLDQAEQLQ